METRRNYTRQKKAYAPKVSEQGKLQPQDKELEEAVLGALMLEKDAYTTVCDILKPECFYEPTNQLIYSAISRLGAQQRPIDMLTVTEQLRLDGKLDEVGGALRISELTGRVASAAHIEYHARIVAQKYLARELIEFSSEILNKAFDETNDVDDLMQEAEGKLFEISQRNLKKDVTQIDPVLSEAIRQIQIAANRSDGLSGLQTGFHDIDKITSGWQNSDLIIIAAVPLWEKRHSSFLWQRTWLSAITRRWLSSRSKCPMSSLSIVSSSTLAKSPAIKSKADSWPRSNGNGSCLVSKY